MIQHRLNTPLTVFRFVETPDGMGGLNRDRVFQGIVKVQVAQPSAEELQRWAAWGVTYTHNVFAGPGTDLRRGDELEGRLPGGETGVLRLHSTVTHSSQVSPQRYLKCEAERVGGDRGGSESGS